MLGCTLRARPLFSQGVCSGKKQSARRRISENVINMMFQVDHQAGLSFWITLKFDRRNAARSSHARCNSFVAILRASAGVKP